MRANAATALRLLRAAAKDRAPGESRALGLELDSLIAFAAGIAQAPQPAAAQAGEDRTLAFNLALRPL